MIRELDQGDSWVDADANVCSFLNFRSRNHVSGRMGRRVWQRPLGVFPSSVCDGLCWGFELFSDSERYVASYIWVRLL